MRATTISKLAKQQKSIHILNSLGLNLNKLTQTVQKRLSHGTLEEIRETHPIMFCMQCEQTSGSGCDKIGMCGKRPTVAALQDLLVHILRGMSQYAAAARKLDANARDVEIDRFLLEAMFSTLTNVNNDKARFMDYCKRAFQLREKARLLYVSSGGNEELRGATEFTVANMEYETLVDAQDQIGVLSRSCTYDADTFALIELITYGVKGAAAYAHHALVQGNESDSIYAGLHECLAATGVVDASVESHLPIALKLGEVNLEVMAKLEEAHISNFGTPTPKEVNTTPKPGKCILVSGHDIQDLYNILKQTEGKDINVYTHGELLPAHGYPHIAAFPHLAGHWGGAWQKQRVDFNDFPGAIVMTTNCIIEPKPTYRKRLFTRQTVGWPDVKHITNDDYSEVIKTALASDPFGPAAKAKTPNMTTGFGADAILANADKVLAAVKSGDLKHFYVIGGCDGRESQRSYFTDLAKNTPKDSVILTLGCGKFRFNTEELGDIGGIPRLLDVGQCNDAYGAIRVALALKEALGAETVNDLPISFGISWFEQKAIAVFLTMLHLDIKNIHLGPRLPAFLTPNLVNFLVKNYGVTPAGSALEDVKKMHAMTNNKLASSA